MDWHKGEAVHFLLSAMREEKGKGGAVGGGGEWAAVCMGDDTTDEDAFRLLERDEHSVTVLVLPEGGGERQTNAKYVCQQPEVADFLQRLAQL
jgi:trehalose-phosphatase